MSTDYSPEYNELLDALTDRGHSDKAADKPLPTDDELWAIAQELGPDAYLPADVRDDMLADLRDAYEDGFHPNLLNLSVIADEVAKLGVPTEVVDTSGGNLTLYCGAKAEDQNGEDWWAVSAGPGYMRRGDAYAHVDEFSYGPHDPDGESFTPEPGTTAKTVAWYIGRQVRLVERDRLRARVAEIAAEAEQVMWAHVAAQLPECTSGDFPPDAAVALSQTIENSVRLWLDANFDPAPYDPDDLHDVDA